MATVTITTVYSDGQTLTAASLNGNLSNLLNAVNIVNSDISGAAAIAPAKIAGTAVIGGAFRITKGTGTFTGSGNSTGPQTTTAFGATFTSTAGLSVVATMNGQTPSDAVNSFIQIFNITTTGFDTVAGKSTGSFTNGVTYNFFWIAIGPAA